MGKKVDCFKNISSLILSPEYMVRTELVTPLLGHRGHAGDPHREGHPRLCHGYKTQSVATNKKSPRMNTGAFFNGVTDGARTHDNLNHNQVLYQLNYGHHNLVLRLIYKS